MSSDKTNEPVEGDTKDTDVAVVDEDSTATELDTAGTEEATESDEAATESETESGTSAARRGPLRWAGRNWAAIVLVVLLIASAGAAGGVYWWLYRPDQLTNPAAQQQAINAARDGTVALL